MSQLVQKENGSLEICIVPDSDFNREDVIQVEQNLINRVGVGHSAMFADKEGKLRIVFHAHKDENNIHPREMYISEVYFEKENGMDRMRISREYIIPQLVE